MSLCLVILTPISPRATTLGTTLCSSLRLRCQYLCLMMEDISISHHLSCLTFPLSWLYTPRALPRSKGFRPWDDIMLTSLSSPSPSLFHSLPWQGIPEVQDHEVSRCKLFRVVQAILSADKNDPSSPIGGSNNKWRQIYVNFPSVYQKTQRRIDDLSHSDANICRCHPWFFHF